MTIGCHVEVDVSKARKLRQRMVLDRLDYERELAHLNLNLGVNPTDLSRQLGVSQSAIFDTLKKASKLPPVKDGFVGATPYEIAQRFAVGEIGRDELIDQLARWTYAPEGHADDYHSLIGDPPGSFEEVISARRHSLIDGVTYDAIIYRMEELAE